MKLYLCLLPLLCLSCAYQFGHGNRTLPGGHKTIFVEMFENQSSEVGAEAAFTQALKEELQRSGLLLVTTKEAAEVILEGAIISVESANSGSEPGFVSINKETNLPETYLASYFTNYSLRVSTNLKLIRSRDKHVIWQTNVLGNKAYRGSLLKKQGLRSSNVLYNQSRRQQTMKLVAQDMMQEAFDRLTESF